MAYGFPNEEETIKIKENELRFGEWIEYQKQQHGVEFFRIDGVGELQMIDENNEVQIAKEVYDENRS